jgi:hypothetical protein
VVCPASSCATMGQSLLVNCCPRRPPPATDPTQTWTATITVPDGRTFAGEGNSKGTARRMACTKALESWGSKG